MEEGETTDKMDLNLLPAPKQSIQSPGVTAIPKYMHAINRNSSLARAFMMHGVACHGPWQQKMPEVKRVFGRIEGGGRPLVRL